MVNRKGFGTGKGMGFKNLMPSDSMTHSMSARGVSTRRKGFRMNNNGNLEKKISLQEEFQPIDEFVEQLEAEEMSEAVDEMAEEKVAKRPKSTQVRKKLTEIQNFLSNENLELGLPGETVTQDDIRAVQLIDDLFDLQPSNDEQRDQVKEAVDRLEDNVSMDRIAEVKATASVFTKLKGASTNLIGAIQTGIQQISGKLRGKVEATGDIELVKDLDDFEFNQIRKFQDGNIILERPDGELVEVTQEEFFGFFEDNKTLLDENTLQTLSLRRGRDSGILGFIGLFKNSPNIFEQELLRREKEKSMLQEELFRTKKLTMIRERGTTEIEVVKAKDKVQVLKEQFREERSQNRESTGTFDFLGF